MFDDDVIAFSYGREVGMMIIFDENIEKMFKRTSFFGSEFKMIGQECICNG